MPDIGYYTLPVIVSMQGVDKQINGKLSKAFEGVGKKATQDIGAGAKAGAADVDKLASSYMKLRDKAEDALGKVRKEESTLQELRGKGVTSGARFVAAEERLATARRNSTRAVSDAKRAHGDLEAGQKKLADGSDKLSGKFSALDGVAGKAGKALGAAGAIAAGAATLGFAALATGLVVVTRALYDLGGEFDEISDNFVIKLGATGDKLEALNKQVTDLGPTLALPMGQIADITVEVNRHLEGTTTELENVIQAVGDLNRMTGTSTDVKKFGQLIRQWNIPAKDQVKTLDMLFNASRKTGKPVNDLMEILTSKGATALRTLNIPLEQSVALLVQFQEAGLDTAAGVDALAKAQKYAATEGIGLQDAMTRAFNAIKAGDDKLAYTIFGKGAGPLIEAVRNGKLSLKDFYAAMEEGNPTIAETAGLTDDFAQKWQKLKNRLEVAIKPVASAVFDGINKKLSDLSDWVIGNQDKVIRFIGDIGVALLDIAKNAISMVQGVIGAIKNIEIAINNMPGWVKTILGIPDQPIDTTWADEAISGLEDIKGKLTGAQDWWRGYTDRAATAVKLTQSLGDTVRATVNEGGEIELSAKPTDEITQKLLSQGLIVTEVNGKFTVTASTPEGQAIIDAYLAQDKGLPIEIKPRLDPEANARIQKQLDDFHHHIRVDVDEVEQKPAGSVPGTAPHRMGPRPRKFGGAIGHFAAGGSVGATANSGATSSRDLATLNRINSLLSQAADNARELADKVKATVNAGGQIVITTNSAEVQEQLAQIGLSTEELPDGTIAIKADTTEGEATLKAFRDEAAKPVKMSTEIEAPELPKPASGLPAGGPTGGGGSANSKGLDPKAASLMAELHAAYPNMDIWGWGPNPDHNTGKCLDAMTLDNPQGLALGDRIVAALLKDPRVNYAIWKQQYFYADGRVLPYGDHGDRNKNHFTHPHIRTFQFGGIPGFGGGDIVPALLEPGEHVLTKDDVAAMGGQENVYAFRNTLHAMRGGLVRRFAGGGQVPDWDAIAQAESNGRWDLPYGDADSSGGLQIQKRTWDSFNGPGLTGHEFPWQATKEQQIMIAEKILAAQGVKAWANGANFRWKTGDASTGGGDTAYVRGTGPKGEAGYYKPADAAEQQSTRDEIAQLEGQIREDKAKIDELKSDAAESDKIAAQNELAGHERDLATQKTKLAEQQKGEFVAGEPPSTHLEAYSASEIQAAQDKAAAAEGKLREAEAEQRELKSDATQSEIEAANNKVTQAKRDKAAADADLAEKKKGKVVEGDASDTHKTEWDAKLTELAQMPGNIVNSLLGDLGIGDIFPDLTQTPMWKSIAAGITSMKGPIQGLVEGKLGIQQPGWQPGQPIPEPAGSGDAQAAGGGGSIPLPFGLPNIEIPPPPAAPEGGQAGWWPQTVNNNNIDAGVHYPPGTVFGTDPVEQAKADQWRQEKGIGKSVGAQWPGN